MNTNSIVPLDNSENPLPIKRTAEEIERDHVLIARMYVRGKSLREIKEFLNQNYSDRRISSKAVYSDLQAIRKQWLESALQDFNAAKVKELARLDEAEREAWDAWDRSKNKHIRIEYETSDDQVPFSPEKVVDIKRKKKRKIIEATVGDIKYLEMVERLIKMRCDILGLFEAHKLQIDWRTEAVQMGIDENTLDAVKEKTINTLVQAIEEAALQSGAIKETDIIDVDMENADEASTQSMDE